MLNKGLLDEGLDVVGGAGHHLAHDRHHLLHWARHVNGAEALGGGAVFDFVDAHLVDNGARFGVLRR